MIYILQLLISFIDLILEKLFNMIINKNLVDSSMVINFLDLLNNIIVNSMVVIVVLFYILVFVAPEFVFNNRERILKTLVLLSILLFITIILYVFAVNKYKIS